MQDLITAGELAKLASTTKRTVLFYDQKGILKPTLVTKNGYRYYSQAQVLDYQKILLLTTLGVPLSEIKSNFQQLFEAKKKLIQAEIDRLQFNLKSLNKFSANLRDNGTLIKPEIKTLRPFGIYYIEKLGPYAKIGQYCEEFAKMFDNKNFSFTTLAIFEDLGYQPQKSHIKIGAIATPNLKPKPDVKYVEFNPGKVITYTHNGSGSLLSLFWKELEKYCDLNKIKPRKDRPSFEIYRKVNSNPAKQFFEIYLPI